jgi:hypothetical protein
MDWAFIVAFLWLPDRSTKKKKFFACGLYFCVGLNLPCTVQGNLFMILLQLKKCLVLVASPAHEFKKEISIYLLNLHSKSKIVHYFPLHSID